MARQRVGEKKVRKLREKLGLPIVTALVRGGTDHRIDLCLEDGSVTYYWKDGTLEPQDRLRWNPENFSDWPPKGLKL